MCPSRMAVQMSAGRRPRVAWNRAQSPSGTTICDTIEMYSGDRVSPVPWSPPVYVRATVTNNPETLRKPSSCTPRPTTTGSVMPNSPSSECGIVRNRTPIARSEEHTSELQSRLHLVCRLLLEKKKKLQLLQLSVYELFIIRSRLMAEKVHQYLIRVEVTFHHGFQTNLYADLTCVGYTVSQYE